MGKRDFLKLIAFIGIISFGRLAIATPNNSMSITPSATSGETITAADENSRNSEISTKYNAHDHADVSSTTANTFTIGDGLTGNKTYAVNDDQAGSPGLRFETGSTRWLLSRDGSTYLAVAHANDSSGLTSGTVLVGATSGAIIALGPPSNGQILIGQTGGAPFLNNITGSGGITVTNGAGSITLSSPAPVVGSFTRTLSLGSGTQTVTGLGFTPRTFHFLVANNAANTDEFSVGFSNVTTDLVLITPTTAGTDTYEAYSNGDASIFYFESAGVETKGQVSSAGDGSFTITFTNSGSPTITLKVLYVAYP